MSSDRVDFDEARREGAVAQGQEPDSTRVDFLCGAVGQRTTQILKTVQEQG